MATKTVTVKGYRSNTGSPHSWWNETGIFVNQGDPIYFSNTLNNGTNNPGFGPSFGPEGDIYRNQVSEDNKNWNDALAYIQGGQRCWFGSLIGKVGIDGDAFCIDVLANPDEIEAPATGFLFLAFNDGVNFEDNDPDGFWDVEVTFEEEVMLDPSPNRIYGSNTIYADLINTCLVDDWGVILTVQAEFTPRIEWSAIAIANLVSAFSAIEIRLATTPYTFKDVFGGVELRHYNVATDAGITTNGNLVRFGGKTRNIVTRGERKFGRVNPTSGFGLDYYPSDYGFDSPVSVGIRNTVIHELGHVLSFRSGSANPTTDFYSTAGTFNLPRLNDPSQTSSDSSNDLGTFWEHGHPDLVEFPDHNTLGEHVADHFLNWVRDSYFGIEGEIDNYNATTMTNEQEQVSAFWVGGIAYMGDTSPGIDGFAADAASVAGTVLDLVIGFGKAVADDDC